MLILRFFAQFVRGWPILAEVKRLGYAINDEETIVGAIFLAAPVFDAQQSVCGSITVGIPKSRFL